MSEFRRRLMARKTKPYDAEVEYIESDGSAYINTGVNVSSALTFKTQLYFPIMADNRWVLGAGDGTNNYRLLRAPADNMWRWDFGTKRPSTTFRDSGIAATHTFDNTEASRTLKIDTYSMTATAATFSTTQPFFLLATNVSGSPTAAFPGARILYAKFYISGTLVRDYIPVRVGQVGYLYDKVSKTLFGNANNTGAFIIGNDK